MPSTGEGFGIVFLEAMASGIHVIGGNQDGSLDPLGDGALGSAVDPDDDEELASAISAALRRPAQRTPMRASRFNVASLQRTSSSAGPLELYRSFIRCRCMDHHKSLSDRYFGHDHVTIIEPQSGWRLLDWRELWAYRELLYVLTMRDIKVRYKQTVLGFAWAIIQPVMMMVVFSIFFGGLAKMPSDGFPYPIFVYAALLPWTFFANAITNSANSLVGSANLVSKVYFPRLIIPLSSVGSGLVDFAIAAAILLLLMVYYGVSWTLNLLVVPDPRRRRSSHGARCGDLPCGAECCLSRFSLRDSVPGAVLDVRHTGGLSGKPCTPRMAVGSLS